ncbi:MAG: hypothetical protein AAGA42_18030 [Actinomycetota bacterium]
MRPTPAALLAVAGSSLLLLAGIVAVAGRWQSIGPEIRLAGLASTITLVFLLAERLRGRLPTTATALAVLAPCLVGPVGVAAASTVGAGWPTCLTIGGSLTAIAADLQARRWRAQLLLAASVIAIVVASFGLAGLTGAPANVVVGAASIGLLAIGAVRRAVALALAVGVSPLIALIAQLRIGPGTLAEVGLSGTALTWSAPLACALASCVVAIVATRYANGPLAVAALAVLGSGVVAGMTSGGAIAAWWWSLPPMVVIGLEAVNAGAALSPVFAVWRRIAKTTSPPLAFATGVVALILPIEVLSTTSTSSNAALPAGIAALALIAAAIGTLDQLNRTTGGVWRRPLALLAANGALFATVAFAGAPVWAASAISVVASIGMLTALPWGRADSFVAPALGWALLGIADAVASPPAASAAVIGVGAAVWLATISFDGRRDRGWRLLAGAAFVGAVTGDVVDGPIAVDAGVVALLAVLAPGIALRRDRATLPLAGATTVALLTLDAFASTWGVAAVLGVLGATYAAASPQVRSWQSAAATALLVTSAGTALTAAAVPPEQHTIIAMACAIALTGVSLVDRRLAALGVGALAAGIQSVAIAGAADPVLVSVAATVAGAVAAALGATQIGRPAALPGTALALGGATSLWWTTGTNQWVIDAIEPYGATGSDVLIGVVALVLLVGGGALRALLPDGAGVPSWLAYGPGFAMIAAWLIPTQLEPGTEWATFGALAVGVIALAVGAIRKLAAPLLVGVALTITTVLVSAGPRLAAAPTWLWIATTGSVLLGLAALVERSERPLLPRPGAERSLIEEFCGSYR